MTAKTSNVRNLPRSRAHIDAGESTYPVQTSECLPLEHDSQSCQNDGCWDALNLSGCILGG